MNLDEALEQIDEIFGRSSKKVSLDSGEQKKLAKVLLDISMVAKEGSGAIKRGDSKTTVDAVKAIELGMKLVDNLLRR